MRKAVDKPLAVTDDETNSESNSPEIAVEKVQSKELSESGDKIEPIPGRCNAHKRSGTLCRNAAGKGTEHLGFGPCIRHGGQLPNVLKSVQREIVKREAESLGLSIEQDPATAIINLVWRCVGDLTFYSSKVAQEELLQVEVGPNGSKKLSAHPWTVLYHQAEDRLAQVSQAALRAGVEERKVRLAERDAQTIFAAIQSALSQIGMNDSDMSRFRNIFASELQKQSSVVINPVIDVD